MASLEQELNTKHYFFGLTVFFGILMLGFYIFFASVVIRYGNYEKDLGWKPAPQGNYYIINEITPSSDAIGKLQVGDKILAINGNTSIQKNYAVLDSFSRIIHKIPVNSTYTIDISRNSKEYQFSLTCQLEHSYNRLSVLFSFFLSSLVFSICGFLIGILKPEEKATRQISISLFVISAFMLMISTKTMSSFLQGWDYLLYLILWWSYPTIFPLAYSAALAFPPKVLQNKLLQYVKYFLSFFTALIFLGLQISLLRNYNIENYLPIIKPLFSNDLFLQYFDFCWDLLIQFSLSVIIIAIVRNYLSVRDLDQRRRIKWVAYSAILGLLPSLINNFFTIFSPSDSHKYETSNHLHFFLARFAEFSVTLVPVSLTYVIIKHQVFDINFVVRRGLQYLLAKNVLRAILVIEFLGIITVMFLNRNVTIRELLSPKSGYFYLVAITIFSFLYHTQITSWLDQVFFRKAYDREKLLFNLIDEIKNLDSVSEISKLITNKLQETLHPKSIYFFYRSIEESGLTLGYSYGNLAHLQNILDSSDLVELMESSSNAKEHNEISKLLSKEENAWLVNLKVQLIVPMLGQDQKLVGLFLLGEKLSDEPYSKNDCEFLETIATQLAIVHEHNLLREKVDKDYKVKQDVLSKLEEKNINLVKECPICNSCFDSNVEFCSKDKSPLRLSLPIERVIEGKYQLDKLIGKGGMGAVYAATDLRLARQVAVKILHGTMFGNQDAIKRFEREAKASAKLTHPSIVAIYDYGKLQAGGAYLVMELVEGITFKNKILHKGTIEPKIAADLFDQILEGIKVAHSARIIHRDLKPDNILIYEENDQLKVKILDFGIAKIKRVDKLDPNSLTAPGTIIGTFGYMPPEQFSAEEVDERSDIFALGVMVIEALTGNRPFLGKTVYELMGSMLKKPFNLPGDLPEIKALDKVLQKCIAKEPKNRFSSIVDMQMELIPAILACPPSAFVKPSSTSEIEYKTTKKLI